MAAKKQKPQVKKNKYEGQAGPKPTGKKKGKKGK